MLTTQQSRQSTLALFLAILSLIIVAWSALTQVAAASPAQQSEGYEQSTTASGSAATIPTTFAYQGVLRLSNGTLATGTYNMTFRIYANPIGEPALFTESINGIAVLDGIFNVILGDAPNNSISPTVFASAPRYVGITVAPDVEMLPRQRINPVPWALIANSASTLRAGAIVPGSLSVGTSGGGQVLVAAAPNSNSAVELRQDGMGGTPYIDFANDPAADWDARVILSGDDDLSVHGSNVIVTGGSNSIQQGAARLSNAGLIVAHDLANLNTLPTGLGVSIDRSAPAVSLRNSTGPALLVEKGDILIESGGLNIKNGSIAIGTANQKAKLDIAGDINFTAQKVCQLVQYSAGWRDLVLVPAGWTSDTCRQLASEHLASYRLVCIFTNSYSFGPETINTSPGIPPSQNCGW